MTPDNISAQVSAELARRDLQDIAELEKSEAFSRYFLRRLKQKHDESEKHFKYDSPDQCPMFTREEWRQRVLAYEELLEMPAKDRAGCQRILGG